MTSSAVLGQLGGHTVGPFVGALDFIQSVTQKCLEKRTYPMRSSSEASLRHLCVSTGSRIRTPDDITTSKEFLVFFQLCCRVATVIFKTLVSDQTARPVLQSLNPCRSVRHRGNSTKENVKTQQKRDTIPPEPRNVRSQR